jgi:hypothetical protein
MARSAAATFAFACGIAAGALGCRQLDAGLEHSLDAPGVLDSPPPPDADAESDADEPGRDARLPRAEAPPQSWDPAPGVSGPPTEIGCADGTREGFTDAKAWHDIAGCAGSWNLVGLQDPLARAPQCARTAGNTGANQRGEGCSVADLCAEGWRVCEDSDDVAASSPTGCESASPEGYAAFFIVRAGASWLGVCGPQAGWTNDLHGCGSWGRAESESCWPLSRRLDFAKCDESDGIWVCGGASDHLIEGQFVSKRGPGLGGALCCRAR